MAFEFLCSSGLFLNGTVEFDEVAVKDEEDNSVQLVLVEDAKNPLYSEQRIILSILFSLLCVTAFLTNVATLLTAYQRKHQILYKCCLVSQALCDLFMAIFVGVDSLVKFTQDSFSWKLGSFMCGFLPFITTMCALISSMTLTCIALDRCQGIIALRAKWDPSLLTCISIVTGIWIVAGGISIPSFFDYYMVPTCILDFTAWSTELTTFCMAKVDRNSVYFTSIFTVIFLPLLTAFIGLYSVIANYIWTRRKPPGSYEQSSSTAETNADHLSTVQDQIKKEEAHEDYKKENVLQSKKLHYTEKKVRTFKIILTIMGTFIICRSPQWIFIVVATHPTVHLDSNFWWVMKYLFSALSLVNAAINPFIYSFLSEMMHLKQNIALGLKGWQRFNFFRWSHHYNVQK